MEVLKYEYENGNVFDIFAIKICRSPDHDKIIGHLPPEVSRPTKFLTDRGATVTATFWSKNVSRSPLFEGRLKVLCRVKVVMQKTLKNQPPLNRDCGRVYELHEETEKDVIVGNFNKTVGIELGPQQKKKENDTLFHVLY